MSAVDLADPAKPVLRSSVEFKAMAQAIHATDRYLFLATTVDSGGALDPANPKEPLPPSYRVTIFDIADLTGLIRQVGAFNTVGRVTDKFKFGLNGDVLSIVSQIDMRWRSNGTWDPSVVSLRPFRCRTRLSPNGWPV